jgi:predicted esterase
MRSLANDSRQKDGFSWEAGKMDDLMRKWLAMLGQPNDYLYQSSFELTKRLAHAEFDGELYRQANGPGTFQRTLLVLPKNLSGRVPAVAVPFYFPEAMLGFELDSGENLPFFAGIEMMLHLARRGFAVISADAYHLTYLASTHERNDFARWQEASAALLEDHPGWTGIGKLIADTRLLVDALCQDPRIDSGRIGIAGHSLGGKMAFYTGCLDQRIKAILASDFGFCWEQSNWGDLWYWGDKIKQLKEAGMDHSQLLSIAAPKPFYLIAGEYDKQDSFDLMQKARGYEKKPECLGFDNHATGHRPPPQALEMGYQFLEKWIGG